MGCMQVMFLVICSRLLVFLWRCEGSLKREGGWGEMKKCSHIHHNRIFYCVIFYDENFASSFSCEHVRVVAGEVCVGGCGTARRFMSGEFI